MLKHITTYIVEVQQTIHFKLNKCVLIIIAFIMTCFFCIFPGKYVLAVCNVIDTSCFKPFLFYFNFYFYKL